MVLYETLYFLDGLKINIINKKQTTAFDTALRSISDNHQK